MRIGLIGVSALGGEHYYNLIEALVDGRVTGIVCCDNNEALRPKTDPEFDNVRRIPLIDSAAPGLEGRLRRIQMFHHIHRNRTGEFPPFYLDHQEMLKSEKLDAVIIGTPNFLHADMAVATLSRRIPTLLEKPVAPSMKDVRRILEAMRENETFLQIGLAFRWRKLFEFVNEKLQSGVIGDLRMAWGREFRGDWKKEPATLPIEGIHAGNWRFSQKHTGGSFLEKLCHDFDAFYWLIGAEPVQATAYGGTGFFPDGRDTVDHAVCLVEYANGCRLSYDYCMAAPYHGRFDGRWMGFIGEKGMLDIDEKIGQVILYETDRRNAKAVFDGLDPATLPGHHRGNNTLFAFTDFLARVERGETKGRFDPAENLSTTHLCLALEESVKRGGQTIVLSEFDPE